MGRCLAGSLLLVCAIRLGALPPPLDQVTAACDAPGYASDTLVCDDMELRKLDQLLLGKINRKRNLLPGSTDAESDKDWFRRSRLCAFESDHRNCMLAAYCLRLTMLSPPDQANPRVCRPSNQSIAASAISRHGLALAGTTLDKLLNREARVWGYVDYQNLYGNDDVKRILGDRWAGYGPDDHSWQFNLKAESSDEPGQSFAVSVPNDLLRDDVLRVLVRNAREGWPTKVYLLGILSTFEAPTNAVRLRGLRMDLRSSRDIRIGESAFDQVVMSGR